MTAVQSVTPAQRTGETPGPRAASHTAEARELLRAAKAVEGDSEGRCAGSTTCRRPGALTVVAEDGAVDLCGLHAMNVVFSTASGPLVLVKSEH